MTVDSPPPRRPIAPPRALWWMIAAVFAVVIGLLMFRSETHRLAPAEANTSTVDRAAVELPASR